MWKYFIDQLEHSSFNFDWWFTLFQRSIGSVLFMHHYSLSAERSLFCLFSLLTDVICSVMFPDPPPESQHGFYLCPRDFLPAFLPYWQATFSDITRRPLLLQNQERMEVSNCVSFYDYVFHSFLYRCSSA